MQNRGRHYADTKSGALRGATAGLTAAILLLLSAGATEAQTAFQRLRNRAGRGGILSQAASSATIVRSDCRQNKDLYYGKDPLQKLDIYSPKSGSNLPVIFYVHGGGWHRGDKKMDAGKGSTYAANGIVFLSVDYRLVPQVKHPSQAEDLAQAFAWTRKNIAQYGGNPDCIFLMGHSAGAHLVDLLATNDRFLAAQGLSLQNIKGVISLDTASLNLNDMLNAKTFEGKFVGPMIEAAFGRDEKSLTDGSPALNVHPGKSYPPFLLYCGSRRKTAPVEQKQFVKALEDAGAKVQLKLVPLSHRDINVKSADTTDTEFPEIMEFIKQN